MVMEIMIIHRRVILVLYFNLLLAHVIHMF